MKKFLSLIICISCTILPTFAESIIIQSSYTSCSTTNKNSMQYANYINKIKKERATISNALQLSEEQSKKRMDLILNTNKCLNEKLSSLYSENLKLRILQSSKNTEETKKQEQCIKNIEKEINDIISDENKEFKKILNHEQRSKLRMIQKLQRKAEKDAKHKKDYYKSNPKMRQFAPHIQCD